MLSPPDQNALLLYKIEVLEKHITETDKVVASLVSDKNAAFKWGILTLGSAVIALGSWIANFVLGHLK